MIVGVGIKRRQRFSISFDKKSEIDTPHEIMRANIDDELLCNRVKKGVSRNTLPRLVLRGNAKMILSYGAN